MEALLVLRMEEDCAAWQQPNVHELCELLQCNCEARGAKLHASLTCIVDNTRITPGLAPRLGLSKSHKVQSRHLCNCDDHDDNVGNVWETYG